jgi:hypothetical protein
VIRAFSRGEQNLTRSSDRGAWSVCLGTLYGVPVAGTLLVDTLVEELVAPVVGAVADHCDDTLLTVTLALACKDRVTVTMFRGIMLNVHATYPCMGGGSSHS